MLEDTEKKTHQMLCPVCGSAVETDGHIGRVDIGGFTFFLHQKCRAEAASRVINRMTGMRKDPFAMKMARNFVDAMYGSDKTVRIERPEPTGLEDEASCDDCYYCDEGECFFDEDADQLCNLFQESY